MASVTMKHLNEALQRLCTIHEWSYGAGHGMYIDELSAATYGRNNVAIRRYDLLDHSTSKPFGDDYHTKSELLAMIKFACNVDYWNTKSPYNPNKKATPDPYYDGKYR